MAEWECAMEVMVGKEKKKCLRIKQKSRQKKEILTMVAEYCNTYHNKKTIRTGGSNYICGKSI